MTTKRSVLAACAILTLSAGVARPGPCNTGGASTDKDAGSGPVTGRRRRSRGESAGETGQHPPTSPRTAQAAERRVVRRRAAVRAQSQATAAERAEGAQA